MNKYIFDGKEYYLGDDVYNSEPESFVGCIKTSRLIISKKGIPIDDYIYKKYNKSTKKWDDSDISYKPAKVFITVSWTHKNLIKFQNNELGDQKLTTQKAPPILILDDPEKFIDIDGNKLDIEVRGTRNINDIYFSVKDISEHFELGDVSIILCNKSSSFVKDIHYTNFIVSVHKSSVPQQKNNTEIKKVNGKFLFLTFCGLTKLLYVSRSKNAEHFQKWANNILFTHQMGSQEEKLVLASSQLGINASTMREILNIDAQTLPCIYLLVIGYVKDLRNSMKIDNKYADDDIVSKYGFTKDLQRRIGEHITTFSKIDGCNLAVKYHSYIDPQYISAAETDVRDYFASHNMCLEYGKNEELIVIPKNQIKMVLKQYQMIGKSYLGHISDLVTKIKELENELERKMHEIETNNLNHKLELERKNHELENKNHELENKNHELEIMKLELNNQKMASELLLLKSKNNQKLIKK